MEQKQIRKHQQHAVDAIMKNLQHPERRILVEMAAGTGSSAVVAALASTLHQHDPDGAVLILTSRMVIKTQLESALSGVVEYSATDPHESPVFLASYTEIQRMHKTARNAADYKYVIFVGTLESVETELLNGYKASILIGFTNSCNLKQGLFADAPCVYRYSLSDAVRDGEIRPSADPRMHAIAIEGFCERFFAPWGDVERPKEFSENKGVDFALRTKADTIYIDVKSEPVQKFL